MKNPNNIILGGILILLGGILLGIVNHWFSFEISMRELSKYWPILIVLAGVAVLFDGRRSIMNSTSVLLVALAIPFGIYNCTSNSINRFQVEIDDDEFDAQISEDDSSSKLDHKSYTVPKLAGVQTAELKIEGGAAEFDLEPSEDSTLFVADTHKGGKINYSLREQTEGSHQKVEFKMKGRKNFKWNEKGVDNKILFKLNTQPIWDIKMEVGAGDVDYDLSKHKVQKLKFETGASNIVLTLGDLLDKTEVDIESGVANIEIKVPESVGCEIKVDGALNAKDFPGFTKINSKLYQTPGFDTATKKILISTESGMSNFEVKRY